MFYTIIIATIRTVVPAVVGAAAAWITTRFGVTLSDDLVGGWTAAIGLAVTAGYYSLVTLLERRVNPAFGWLLGVASAPVYPEPSTPDLYR